MSSHYFMTAPYSPQIWRSSPFKVMAPHKILVAQRPTFAISSPLPPCHLLLVPPPRHLLSVPQCQSPRAICYQSPPLAICYQSPRASPPVPFVISPPSPVPFVISPLVPVPPCHLLSVLSRCHLLSVPPCHLLCPNKVRLKKKKKMFWTPTKRISGMPEMIKIHQ